MKNHLLLFAGFILLLAPSCEKECPECPECIACELEHVGLNSEWGEKVRNELIQLFYDIEDLALVRVYNTSGDITYWSGFDAGDPMEDSRQIQVDFMDTTLRLIWKRFEEGSWKHSLIELKYDDINTTVLQYVKFIEGGMVVRRANNVLLFICDHKRPCQVDGVLADAANPEGLIETSSREIFTK